jgi:hypothetical protein
VHPYLMQALSTDRIRDWQRQAEQARWIKEARHARPAHHARPARELIAAALQPLGIRRVPSAQPAEHLTGGAEGQSAAADERRSAGSPVA